jgi:hypothetical protein
LEKLNFQNLKCDQLGYVYKDIEKAAQSMKNHFGISNFIIFPPTPHEMIYKGKPSTMIGKLAVANLFNLQIELIQCVEGASVYTDFIEKGNEGLHHIRFGCEDLSIMIEHMKEEGYEVLQQGRIVTISYAYFDTIKDFGIIIEFGSIKRRGKGKK